MEVVSHSVLVNLGQAALLRADGAGEVAEVVDRQRDVGGEGLAHGLAVLPGLRDGDLFQVLLDAVGDAVQQKRALCRGGLAEGLESLLRSVNGQVDIRLLAAGHLAENLTGHRGDVVHVLAVDRRYPLAADVVVIALAEVDDGIRGAWVCVQSHKPSAFLVDSVPSRWPPAQTHLHVTVNTTLDASVAISIAKFTFLMRKAFLQGTYSQTAPNLLPKGAYLTKFEGLPQFWARSLATTALLKLLSEEHAVLGRAEQAGSKTKEPPP